MWLSGIKALSTWVCSWIEGLDSANTCRSWLPKPSNVEPLWLGSCPTLVVPRTLREGWWQVWQIRSCFMQLRSGQVTLTTILSRRSCSRYRAVVLKIVSAYWTVSTSAVLVLVSVPPIDLLAEERKDTFQLRKELTSLNNLQTIARTKEVIHKDGTRRLVEKWKTRWNGDQSGRWRHCLIP